MKSVLLAQLPIPRLNFGRQTGNIPLGAACLKSAVRDIPDLDVEILPESIASYLGDFSLIERISSGSRDVIGFTAYCWNVERSLYIAGKIKEKYSPEIIFGGPEITSENLTVESGPVDLFVYGEGESIFRKLLLDPIFPDSRCIQGKSSPVFKSAQSPYVGGLLEPEIENLMLLETQRGCPYRCGFCYYNKSRSKILSADEAVISKGISWAMDNKIPEIYLLDPSLNTRPDLKDLLQKIIGLNTGKKVSLFSEIRAEAIDETLAALFEKTGFTWFEIGLQSTNSSALAVMNRPTDLKRFVRGAALLKKRGIVPGIDLIVGLPGDTPEGFKKTVDFVVQNDLFDDIQVFPLSVLPGTHFRSKSLELGLIYDPKPPYTVIRAPGFSEEDMLMAFDLAESRFDTTLYPMPDLDAGFGDPDILTPGPPSDIEVRIGGRPYAYKVLLLHERPFEDLHRLSCRVTSPYQIFFGPLVKNIFWQQKVLEVFTKTNPFTPVEVIFIEPGALPETAGLLSSVRLSRPHFLDNDLRYLFADPGNRAVLFTLVSSYEKLIFSGDMKRQVYWWKHSHLPVVRDLKRLRELDGILIQCSSFSEQKIIAWQDRLSARADDHLCICFSEPRLQKRWLKLTLPDEYFLDILPE